MTDEVKTVCAGYGRSYLCFLPVLLLALAAVSVIAINRPCWNDECHFVKTVLLFQKHPTVATLMHYEEMSTPLPFMLYALWGSVAGNSLPALRVLSLIIAFITFSLFHYLFYAYSGARPAFLLSVFLLCIPDMMGISVFVYTDMLMLFAVALFFVGFHRRSAVLITAASVIGLLSRQYFVFITGTGIAFYLFEYWVGRRRDSVWKAGALLFSVAPLCALFVLWRGMYPINEAHEIYIIEGMRYDPHAVTLYVSQIFIYLLPVLLVTWKTFYKTKRVLVLSAGLSLFSVVFPVMTSLCWRKIGRYTLGHLHGYLLMWFGERVMHYCFFIFFALALPVVIAFGSDLYRRIKNRKADCMLLLDLSIFAFFAVMPFSYICWEKYFLPILPLVALQIVLLCREGTSRQAVKT